MFLIRVEASVEQAGGSQLRIRGCLTTEAASHGDAMASEIHEQPGSRRPLSRSPWRIVRKNSRAVADAVGRSATS